MPRATSLFALGLFCFASCASTPAPDPKAQDVVEAVAAKNDKIVRLTVHAMLPGKTSYTAVASTLSSKLGEVSDPEDLQAIKTGEVIVLEKNGGIDVTVPISKKNGAFTVAAGVTLPSSMDRAAAIDTAKEIAADVERRLMQAP